DSTRMPSPAGWYTVLFSTRAPDPVVTRIPTLLFPYTVLLRMMPVNAAYPPSPQMPMLFEYTWFRSAVALDCPIRMPLCRLWYTRLSCTHPVDTEMPLSL